MLYPQGVLNPYQESIPPCRDILVLNNMAHKHTTTVLSYTRQMYHKLLRCLMKNGQIGYSREMEYFLQIVI